MGGNQGWWKNENKNIEDSGCGLIAMSDLELYLLDTRAYQISDAGILKKMQAHIQMIAIKNL